jgi:hypothetical protein
LAEHEGFSQHFARLFGGGDHRVRFGEGERKGFFAEYVFARAQGFDGPFDVQVIRKRIVDHVNVGVGEQGLVTAARARDVPLAGVGLGGRFAADATASRLVRLEAFRGAIKARLMRAVESSPQLSEAWT